MPNFWGHFKDEVLKACDEVWGKKRWRSKGDTRWWCEEVKKAVSRKEDAHNLMFQNSTEENKRRCKSTKNEAVSKARKLKRRLLNKNCPNVMCTLVKGLKTDSKEVEDGRCMSGSDGKLFSVRRKELKSGWIIWKGSGMKKMIGNIMWKEML